MKVITAPDEYKLEEKDVTVFLAGGITDCEDWQSKVIEELDNSSDNLEHLVVFNPRRENFPIDDPLAAYKQIHWEFDNIERSDIFSMYFAASETSVQPICMYELGRNIARWQTRFPADWVDRIVISVQNDYKRKNDVLIQSDLASYYKININTQINDIVNIEYHVRYIIRAYKKIINKEY